MNKDKQEKGSYTNMKPHELRNYTCVVKTDSDEIHCTRNKPMKTYKQKVLEEFDERFKMAGTYPMGVFQGNKVKQFIEKTLQEQREEVRKAEKDRVVRIVTEYFEKGLGFNKGSMNDSVFEGLKDTLLKQLKK